MTTARHKSKTVAAIVALVVTVSLSSSCMWAPELARVCRDIERQIPGANFDKEFAITLGPITLAFAKMVTAFIPDAKEARGYLKDVSKIQVAVYEAQRMPAPNKVVMPDRLKYLIDEGWEMAVRAREEDSVVWVLYKIDRGAIRELYVVVLDQDELVLVKAKGHLERLVARALLEAKDTRGVPHIERYGNDPWDNHTHDDG